LYTAIQTIHIYAGTHNSVIYASEELDTCISGSIASPNEKAMVPRALKALKDLDAELPCKLYFTDVLSIFFPKRCCKQKKN
jgi:hypothetical protein